MAKSKEHVYESHVYAAAAEPPPAPAPTEGEPSPPQNPADFWSPEQLAKAQSFGAECVALYQMVNDRLEALCSLQVQGLRGGLIEPIAKLKELGVTLPPPPPPEV